MSNEDAPHEPDHRPAVGGPVERMVRPGSEARWYCVDAKGMAQLCADEADARWEVADNTKVFPKNAPYGAVQLIDVAAWADSERSVREHRDRLRAALSDLVSRYDQRLPLRERPEFWDAARAALKA